MRIRSRWRGMLIMTKRRVMSTVMMKIIMMTNIKTPSLIHHCDISLQSLKHFDHFENSNRPSPEHLTYKRQLIKKKDNYSEQRVLSGLKSDMVSVSSSSSSSAYSSSSFRH